MLIEECLTVHVSVKVIKGSVCLSKRIVCCLLIICFVMAGEGGEVVVGGEGEDVCCTSCWVCSGTSSASSVASILEDNLDLKKQTMYDQKYMILSNLYLQDQGVLRVCSVQEERGEDQDQDDILHDLVHCILDLDLHKDKEVQQGEGGDGHTYLDELEEGRDVCQEEDHDVYLEELSVGLYHETLFLIVVVFDILDLGSSVS